MTSIPRLEPRQRQQLLLQDEVWAADIEAFLDRLELRPGDRVLEIGCGLGLDLPRLARRVGAYGEVVGVESNPFLAEECAQSLKQQGLKRVRVVLGPVPEGQFRLVYCSWKPGMVQPAPGSMRALLDIVTARLQPKGVLAVWEHQWDGFALLPASAAMEVLLQAHRESQPDLGVARLLRHFAACGFLLDSAWTGQQVEAPGSASHRWAEQFLYEHGPQLLEQDQWQAFLADWEQRRLDPATLLFSPRAMGLVGRTI